MVVTDLRTVSFDVPKQEVLTKDSVTVNVDAVVYYNIYSPLDATCKVEWGYKECAHTGKFGTIHLRRRHALGGEGSNICQICRRIVLKNCRR